MRAYSLAALLVALIAAPVLSMDLVEMKDGRLYEAQKVWVRGDRLHIQLHRPDGESRAEFAVATEKVVPEFVFYAWRDQIMPGDVQEMQRLAKWARKNGLFTHAWAIYKIAADSSSELRSQLPSLEQKMRDENATWLFTEAWRLFQEGDVHKARIRVERLLGDLPGSKEHGRATELLGIIQEREQFLSEQKKARAAANRARFQKRTMGRWMDIVEKANRLVGRANLNNAMDAGRKLRLAQHRYRKAMNGLADILDEAEVDELRMMLVANLNDIRDRHVKTTLMYGDMRMMIGDPGGALTEAHEVLDFEPANEMAKDLRKRALDSTKWENRWPLRGWGYFGWGWRRRWPICGPGIGWGGGWGWGGGCAVPFLSARGASGAQYAISGVPAIGYQRRVSVAPGVTAIKRSARGPHPFPYPHGYHVSRVSTPWGSRVMKWTDGYAFPQPAPQGMR